MKFFLCIAALAALGSASIYDEEYYYDDSSDGAYEYYDDDDYSGYYYSDSSDYSYYSDDGPALAPAAPIKKNQTTTATTTAGKASFEEWKKSVDQCQTAEKLSSADLKNFEGDGRCFSWYSQMIEQALKEKKNDQEISCKARVRQNMQLLSFLERVSQDESKCLVCSFRRVFRERIGASSDIFDVLLSPKLSEQKKQLAASLGRSELASVWADRDKEDGPALETTWEGGAMCLVPFLVDDEDCVESAAACTLSIPSFEKARENSFTGSSELFLAEGFNLILKLFGSEISPKGWNFFIERFASSTDSFGFFDEQRWETARGKFDISKEQQGDNRRRRLVQRDSSFS